MNSVLQICPTWIKYTSDAFNYCYEDVALDTTSILNSILRHGEKGRVQTNKETVQYRRDVYRQTKFETKYESVHI
jgi:hypothetical protein